MELYKPLRLKRVCPECGFKHRESTNSGVFVPRNYNGGRYDEPDTPRKPVGGRGEVDDDDDDSDEEAKRIPIDNSENPKLANLFASNAPKTASEKIKEARLAAGNARKLAALKLNAPNEDNEAGEDLTSLHRRMTTKEKARLRKTRLNIGRAGEKLNTPKFVLAIGYVRCNCVRGVPNDSPKEYAPVDGNRYVDSIPLRSSYVSDEHWKKITPPSNEVLELVSKFLDGRSLALSSMVNTSWNAISNAQPHYLDLKYMEVLADFAAHDGKVESVFVYRERVYTAGNKMVKVWGVAVDNNAIQQFDNDGLELYSLQHTPVRDTALITKIVKTNMSMYTCASNGAVREWVLAHTIKNIKFAGALWEHSGFVNDLVASSATPGTCTMHGIVNHECLLYSSSDDRKILVWDTITRKKLGTIEPPNKKCGTMRGLAMSERHLFVGSSTGLIYIYPFERTCERTDRHNCSLEAGPTRFCLQNELVHGNMPITSLLVCGRFHGMEYLVSGSMDGTIVVWELEEEGYDFEAIQIFTSHTAPITSLTSTWSHIYSSSDDGTVKIWCLSTFTLQRVLDCGGRVKSVYIREAVVENEESLSNSISEFESNNNTSRDDSVEEELPCGYLYCGMADGRVMKWRLGVWM